MGFAGGEVLFVRRAWWQRLVEGHSVSAGGEGRVGDTQAAGAMPTLRRPAPTYIRWCGLCSLSCWCEEEDCPKRECGGLAGLWHLALHSVAGRALALSVGWVDKMRAIGGKVVLVAVFGVTRCSIPPRDDGEWASLLRGI